jgi:hypothetical protein
MLWIRLWIILIWILKKRRTQKKSNFSLDPTVTGQLDLSFSYVSMV